MNDLKTLLVDYDKKYNAFPETSWLLKRFKNVDEKKLIEILDKLVKQNFLGKTSDKKYYVKKSNVTKPIVDSTNNKNIINQFTKVKEFIFKIDLSEGIIKIIMFIISICCIIVSIHYTYELLLSYLDPFYCLILSSSLVTYASFAFQAASRISQKGYFLFPFLLRSTAIIVLCFSMISTVAGQYKNNTMKIESTTKAKEDKNLKLYEDKAKQINETIKQVTKQIDSNQNRLDTLSKKENLTKDEQIEYNQKLNNNAASRNRIENLNKELQPINEILNTIYTKEDVAVKEKQNDFYVWVNGVFPMINPNQIEMLMYLLFAVFIDIMAPLGIAIFLGHYESKEPFFKKLLNKILTKEKEIKNV